MNDVVISLTLGIVLGIAFTMMIVVDRVVDYGKYKDLLIDFGHARYVVDERSGESTFQIDPVPLKQNKQ